MFEHILVPLDGSQLAEDVLAPVVTLASGLGSRVTLIHVLERNAPATVHGEPHITDSATGAHYLGSVADRISAIVPRVEVHIHARPVADVATAINAHAAELRADLIAMCRHGRSGLRQALVGGIAQRILRGGGTAVLLRSRPEDATADYHLRQILAPIDLDHDATRSLEISAVLAREFQAGIHLLTAVPSVAQSRTAAVPVSLAPRAEAAEIEMQIEDTDRRLVAQAEWMRAEGITVTHEVSRAEPADAIVATAAALPADLVVMTTHARAGVQGWYHGSTGFRVIGKTPQTLLLLRDL